MASATLGDAFSAAVSPSTARTRAYCRTFGYDFLLCDRYIDDSQSPYKNKLLWISRNLPNYEAIFWIDGDALIVDPSRPIEQVIGGAMADRSKDLIITRDWAGNINTGVFWIRNTPWSRRVMHDVQRRCALLPISRAGGADNTAFVQLYHSETAVAAKTCVLDAQTVQINCFPHYGQAITKETFALHFAGVSDLRLLRRWLDHYTDAGAARQLANQLWYPMLRAKVWRHAPWILESHARLSIAWSPSLRIAERLLRLAWLYHHRGKEAKARSLFQRSLHIQEIALGPKHHLILEPLELYRVHLLEFDHEEEASALAARVREIRAMWR